MDGESTHDDRRVSDRIHGLRHAEVRRTGTDSEDDLRVQIMNLSEGGVRFITSENFEEGESFTLFIDNEPSPGKVVGTKQIFQGYAIRGEFITLE